MYEFQYAKPKSVADAVKALASDPDGKALAGGQTLIPTLKQRLAQPTTLLDLGAIPELKGIKVEGDAIVIGAMTRHAEVAASPDVKRLIPALAGLADNIGDPAVRNRGTLGGSVANNDPAADYPGALVALGATITTSKRTIAAEDFFTGLFTTALDADEILVSVKFPKPKRAAYTKFRNPASRYAIVGVFVADTAAGIRVAVTGAGPGVFRQKDMEAALAKSWSPASLDGITVKAGSLNSDIHASSEYRAHLVGVMAKRAVAAAS